MFSFPDGVPPFKEHVYTESYKKSDLTLKLLARGKADTDLPPLFEGDPITGTVVLNVHEKSPIKSVSVEVRFVFN